MHNDYLEWFYKLKESPGAENLNLKVGGGDKMQQPEFRTILAAIAT